MDLGRQRAYTGIRALPIEGHVMEKLFFFGQFGLNRTVMEVMVGFRLL